AVAATISRAMKSAKRRTLVSRPISDLSVGVRCSAGFAAPLLAGGSGWACCRAWGLCSLIGFRIFLPYSAATCTHMLRPRPVFRSGSRKQHGNIEGMGSDTARRLRGRERFSRSRLKFAGRESGVRLLVVARTFHLGPFIARLAAARIGGLRILRVGVV